MKIAKVVVAYDGLPSSKKALAWAVDFSKGEKCDVIVVTVVKPPEFSSSIDEVDEFYADGERHQRPFLEEAAVYGKQHDVTLQTELLRGHPAESLVRYAMDQKADMIVMGTRGMGAFKNLIIGSVAQKVIASSNIPVMVMK